MFKDQQQLSERSNHKPKVWTKTKTCRLFASGNCRFGDRCRFLHITDDQDDSVVEQATDPSLSAPDNSEIVAVGKTEVVIEVETPQKVAEKPQRNCKYFSLHGTCKFGDGCRFRHASLSVKVTKHAREVSEISDAETHHDNNVKDTDAATESNVADEKKKQTQTRTCRFFKRGYCAVGNRCRFRHEVKDASKDRDVKTQEASSELEPNNQSDGKEPRKTQASRSYVSHPPVRGPVPQSRQELLLKNMTPGELLKLRSSEIKQLKTRFRKTEVIERGDNRVEQYRFQVGSTDPDWPYDVNKIDLLVSFPMDYPKEAMEVFLPKDQDLPDTLRRHVLRAVEGWLSEKHRVLQAEGRVQLTFRPFLRWLDRKMEALFTEGLKLYQKELMARAAGFEFIPATHLQEKVAEAQQQQEAEEEDGEEGDQDEDAEEEEAEEGDSGHSDTEYSDEEESEETDRQQSTSAALDPVKRGTEVKLRSLELIDGASSLLLNKMMLTVQCSRCKHRQEITTPVGRANSMQCAQCHQEELVTLRGSLAHEFTSVVGYLDMVGCSAFDLVLSECSFTVGCLMCNKTNIIEGLNPGQLKKTWCNHCHQKLAIATEGAKFSQLMPSDSLDTEKAHVVDVKKVTKVVRDPAIQSGKPLPDEGTCRHYKKSFRWFRFPCCGKAFPCDICHDSKENHEMKLANRMICGFCAKEQPFSMEKPCSGCGSALTKRFTVHWEGGRGCRDKVKMSRNDIKKFSNQNKTQSRKSQAKDQPKKTVKIRHSSN